MTKVEQQQQRQEWEVRVASYRSSGLGAAKWCAANGVKLHQLRYRLQQERTGSVDDTPSATWLRAAVSEIDTGLLIRVGEAVIEVRPGFDPDLLCAVVRALSATC